MTLDHPPKYPRGPRGDSIWDAAQYVEDVITWPLTAPLDGLGLSRWAHWPGIPNYWPKIMNLRCKDDWWSVIQMLFWFGVQFFSVTVIPSPLEVSRKILLGGYKCGFYSPVRIRSPLNFFLGKGGTQFLGELVSPYTRALFYIWAADSIFTALQSWQLLMKAQEQCTEGAECEALMTKNNIEIRTNQSGTLALLTVGLDECGIASGGTGQFIIPPWVGSIMGKVNIKQTEGPDATVKCWLEINGQKINEWTGSGNTVRDGDNEIATYVGGSTSPNTFASLKFSVTGLTSLARINFSDIQLFAAVSLLDT